MSLAFFLLGHQLNYQTDLVSNDNLLTRELYPVFYADCQFLPYTSIMPHFLYPVKCLYPPILFSAYRLIPYSIRYLASCYKTKISMLLRFHPYNLFEVSYFSTMLT